jgi:hypothetical protein
MAVSITAKSIFSDLRCDVLARDERSIAGVRAISTRSGKSNCPSSMSALT